MTHQALVALAEQWEREAAVDTDPVAAAAVRLCAGELRDALTSAGAAGSRAGAAPEDAMTTPFWRGMLIGVGAALFLLWFFLHIQIAVDWRP